jgi:alpha-glucosidase (family GH31 glycosyl hydrolase)
VARPRFVPIALVLASTAACSKKEEAVAPPVDGTVGGFVVHLEPEPLRLAITTPSGHLVFDGLAPADVAAPSADVDPPPLTGLAVRDVVTGVESSFGAFQFTDVGAPWRVARSASSVVSDGAGVRFDALDGGGGLIARVVVGSDRKGELSIAITPADEPATGARTWASLASKCDPQDRFLGFGDQARDAEHRGFTVPIFTSEPGIGKRDDDANTPIYYLSGARHASSFPLPLFVAKSGFAGVIDSPGRSLFSMCSERDDVLRVSADVTASLHGSFVYRIIDAPTPKDAARAITAHWGRPRMPPRLAFGVWNDAIFGAANVRTFAKYLRDHDVPSSAIWTEDFRGGAFVNDNYRLSEEWDFDPTLYPDPAQLTVDLRTTGYAWLLYFNTFVETDVSFWKEADKGGYLIEKADGSTYTFQNAKQKPASMVDLTSVASRNWMTGKLKKALAVGVAGWMGDYGEWLPLDAKLADGSDPWATHDLYPQLWQTTQRDALDADDVGGAAIPKAERLAFVRSGWLGSAPLIDVFWPGDQRTDMEADDGFPTIIPQAIGLSFAGISTHGSDIAGYQSATNEYTSKETFFRWTELGAWSPVMRTHHGTAPKKEWHLDSDDETLAHWRNYAILHQQLLPTWERLAKEASDTGITIWRHLATEFPADPAAWINGYDEVMVGDSILVAPVIEKGATSRSVYLPKGASWFVLGADGKPIDGGVSVVAQAAIASIPVFLRGGSITTLLPDRVRTVLPAIMGVTTVEDVGDDRVLLVAAGPDATTTETSGLSYALTGAGALALPATTTTWNGVPLAACAAPVVAPCLEAKPGHVKARVSGPGTLALDAAKVQILGGSATRSLLVDVVAVAK